MLSSLPILPPDPLWGLTNAFRQDPRPNKMDLVIGIYRDAAGKTPVLDVVKQAEIKLAEAGISKAYRSLSGNFEFNEGMAKLLLGHQSEALKRQYTMQTVGGTGALRLLAEFIAAASPDSVIWSTNPGYINHKPIMEASGLRVEAYHWREVDGTVDIDLVLKDLSSAKAGDVVLLHGACHNPSGFDMPMEGWKAIADLCEARGVVPLVDMAYQGFGDGIDEDASGMRTLVNRLETVLIAASCSKNMGLYCERTGAAAVVSNNRAVLNAFPGTMERIARSSYSMPPEHGAAVAAMVLQTEPAWRSEVEAMRQRIVGTRDALGTALEKLGAPEEIRTVRKHKGMFSLLPLSPEAMKILRDEYAIYGTDNGRINVAGIQSSQIDELARALVAVAATARIN